LWPTNDHCSSISALSQANSNLTVKLAAEFKVWKFGLTWTRRLGSTFF
jgi:hypothetical protein